MAKSANWLPFPEGQGSGQRAQAADTPRWPNLNRMTAQSDTVPFRSFRRSSRAWAFASRTLARLAAIRSSRQNRTEAGRDAAGALVSRVRPSRLYQRAVFAARFRRFHACASMTPK